MKNCVGVADLLCAYADGELDDSSRQLVEDHLTICENCSAVLKVYREISYSISETNVPAPEALRLGVMNRIQSESTPRATENNNQRGSYRYILTRYAPIAACLVVGLLAWQFWGSLFGSDNAAMPAAAPEASVAAPAAAPPEADWDDIAPAPAAAQMETAEAFDLDIANDEAPPPGRIGLHDGEGIDFLEILYEEIDGFGPLGGPDAKLFREASVVITITGDLPIVLAQAEPEPDWEYGRYGWEQLYVISRQMLASLIDEVGDHESTTVIYNPDDNNIDTISAYIIILFSYGL